MGASIKNYISFSKKEGIAAIILVLIVLSLAVLPFINKQQSKKSHVAKDPAEWASAAKFLDEPEKEVNPIESRVTYSRTGYSRNFHNKAMAKARLFPFDPNTATTQEFKELGLRDKTVQILNNYRNKGGKFRRADDLQKIYGLRPEEFERLRPYIVIRPVEMGKKLYSNDQGTYISTPVKEYKRKVALIDINTADTTAFQSLYGIGSRLAARIVNYRNKLGGFYSIEQVGETYGVPEETFQNIKKYLIIDATVVNKLNLNTASYDELNAHPYISSKLAFLIMKYRKETGNITSPDILKELVDQSNDTYEKVIAYVAF